MAGAPPPQIILEAIASAAGGGFITNPIPEAPTGTNAASIQGGYPPVTMQQKLAGGKPPLGQDENGFMFLWSSHILALEYGQQYLYNSDLAAANGGYPVGAILGMADGTGLWLNTVNGQTGNPDTAAYNGWVPIAQYGIVIIPVSNVTVTLTPQQSKQKVIVFTGALTANVTVLLPQNTGQEWLLVNSATGAFTLTASSGAAGVVIPQGGPSAPTGVYAIGDGKIYPTVAPLGIPIDQNPNPLTIVERTNAGQILATYFFSTQPTDNITVATVFTGSGDGYLRMNSLTNFESQVLLQGLAGQLTNGQVPFSVVSQWASALFSSPAFTGVPVAPTAALGTSNTQVATTGFANPGASIAGAGPWFEKHASGVIKQWGVLTKQSSTQGTAVGFAIAFPNVCQTVQLTSTGGTGGGGASSWTQVVAPGSPNVNGFQINADNFGTGAPDPVTTVYWEATGR